VTVTDPHPPTDRWDPHPTHRPAPPAWTVPRDGLSMVHDSPRPGSAPWYGLPPVDETAPPGVQITARVRSRSQHANEYGRRPLAWLDGPALGEVDDKVA